MLSSDRLGARTRAAGYLVAALMLIWAPGCNKAREAQSDRTAKARPPELARIGEELSGISQVSIRRVKGDPQAFEYRRDFNEVQAKRCSLLRVLRETATPPMIQEVPVLDEAPLPGGIYDVSVTPEGRDDDPWLLLVKACEGAFGVRISRARRSMNVYVLAAPRGRPGALRPARPGERSKARSTAGGHAFHAKDMEHLARFLAMNLGKTVVDETRMKGAYTFELKMDAFTQTELLEAVKELGLELKEAQRAVEAVVVRKAGPPTSTASSARSAGQE